MSTQTIGPTSTQASRSQSWLSPERICLTIMWVITTVTTLTMLWFGVRGTDRYNEARTMLHIGYVAALLWYLGRLGPPISRLPEIHPMMFLRWKVRPWIPVLGISLMLASTMISDSGVAYLMILMMVATIWILLVWRREIRLQSVILGLVVTLIAFLGGLPFWDNNFIGGFSFILRLLIMPLMFIAGGLLYNHTRLGGIQLLARRYRKTLGSFLWGCLLFVPLGLINAAGGSPGGNITWVDKWWMPFSLPWFSGITEETWFRLFLVGLCYFLLRPASRTYPELAFLYAVLFSAITFGLGHGRTPENFLFTGLLYGLPMAVVFARRDWEHAVGAHYMINFFPWVMVFLEN